jgi:S1-C subfamily serine protease
MSSTHIASQWSRELADAVASAARAVVFTQGRRGRAASGTVIADKRFVVSDHLLDADETVAYRDDSGAEHRARVIGRDGSTDLALLSVEDGTMAPLELAAEPVRVGHLVLAVGRTSGGPVARPGHVAAISGPHDSSSGVRIDALIHTTLSPFSGFSGGALVDPRGALIGVSTSAVGRGAGLAIPIADVQRIVASLERHGRVRRGFLGVTTLPVAIPASQRSGPDTAERGLLVSTVLDGSPAAGARVLVGDIIVAIGGTPVKRTQDLLALLGGDRVGSACELAVVRGREAVTLEVTIGERGVSASR